jgi:hypothetical protein
VELLPALIPLRTLDIGAFASRLDFYDEVGRVLIGVDVLCFVGQTAPPADGIDNGEVCLTEAGIPLLVTASGSGTTASLTATATPGALDQNAFDLPFPVEQR